MGADSLETLSNKQWHVLLYTEQLQGIKKQAWKRKFKGFLNNKREILFCSSTK